MRHLLEERGVARDEVNATVGLQVEAHALVPVRAWSCARALSTARQSPAFAALAELFKRVKNISKGVPFTSDWPALIEYANGDASLTAEKDLIRQVAGHATALQTAGKREPTMSRH